MVGAPRDLLSLPSWRAERILYDERGLLVVDKPPGIPVYGGPEGLCHGLVDRVGLHLETLGRGRRLGVHQRLDQGTSGACLFTTSADRDGEVADAIASRSLRRTYVAVCEDSGGRLKDQGSIRLQVDKQGSRARVVPRGGKLATTDYRVLERRGRRALVELSLQTGRFHQIRVSLAHWGAPLVGDEVYGGPRAERLFLHATELSCDLLPEPARAPIPEAFDTALSAAEPAIPTRPLPLLRDALCLRQPLLALASAFRLVNGDGDALPGLTVDYYAGFAVINLYDHRWVTHLDALALELLAHGCRGVYEKRRLRADLRHVDSSSVAPSAPIAGEAAPSEHSVREGAMSLLVDLTDGLSTGLFVDQRDNHEKTRAWAANGRVLNLFCYTGAFSVAAALSGARVTSVDLSGRALARAKKNFELNHLSLQGHGFVKEDAMKFLARAERRGERYDFIVLDPPSFSTVGKGTFSVKGRYAEAAALCVRLLGPGGKLLCVTNHTKTTAAHLRGMLDRVALESTREVRYLKVLPSGLDCPKGASGAFPSKSVLLEVQ